MLTCVTDKDANFRCNCQLRRFCQKKKNYIKNIKFSVDTEVLV